LTPLRDQWLRGDNGFIKALSFIDGTRDTLAA
jgi:hypothetical protein